MKKRDMVLFSLPLTALVAVIGFAVFLYWQINNFEKAYISEAKGNVAQETRLVSAVISPMLEAGKVSEAVKFCNSFDRDTLRVTLIGPDGTVEADSVEETSFLGNHLDREEVISALNSQPGSVVRYSESLGQWMIYYALPIRTDRGVYVLRSAVSTDRVSRIIDFSRLNMFWALLFGGELVLVLAFYVVRKVRRPLISLQHSVEEIAAGKLDYPVEIPESGLMRDLALGVSEMTSQLKTRLMEVTAERNARELLFQSMDEGVLLFASDGSLVRFNPAAAKLFGFDPDDGKFNLSRSRMPELLIFARDVFRTGESFEHEFTPDTDGGEQRSLFIKGHLQEENGEKYLFMTVTDLTNLRRLEAFRSDFVANVSHEIKTPLTCIVGAAEALEDDLPAEQRMRLLDMIKKHAKRLNNLVQDILSLAALEKEQLKSKREFAVVSLDNVVANAVNLCRVNVEAVGMELDIKESVPLKINGDASLLEQSLINLIENAVKYSQAKHISVNLCQEGSNAVITVSDDGIGIPPEHRARIFERFYRVDKSRSRELGGTGLGLAIVKHIAQLHHGRAELSENNNGGCCFRLVFPL